MCSPKQFVITVFTIALVAFGGSAHAVTYLSNVNNTTWGGSGVNGNWGLGQAFRTGNVAAGYTLNSVTLSMVAMSPGASGFNVSIYSNLNDKPASPLQFLSGNPDPQFDGLYDYNSSGLTLSPNATYWIVARASGTAPFSAYFWELTKEETYTSQDGWQIPFGSTFAIFNEAAGQWGTHDPDIYGPLKFALNAIPVPEPAGLSLVGLGLGFCILKARTRR